MIQPIFGSDSCFMRVPRPRGDDPLFAYIAAPELAAFPAHAGMIRWGHHTGLDIRCVPRPRGDDPV